MFQTFDETAETSAVAARVAALRARMKKARIDAFLVPRGDEHRGEYVAASAERLKWLTAFSGSAGLAVVGTTKAALFVDGRYTVQAPQQTNSSIFDIHQIPAASYIAWLADNVRKDAVVGYDPWLHSVEEVDRLAAGLKKAGVRLKALTANPIDKIWGDARPDRPLAPVTQHPANLAGTSAADKLAAVQAELVKAEQDAVVLTSPDSVCWLFNIRGADIPHTPVVLAFAIIPKRGKAELFIDSARLDAKTREHVKPVARTLAPVKLRERLVKLKADGKCVRIAFATAADWFRRQLGRARIVDGSDPCVAPKSIKNASEIKGMRKAHQRDAVAVCRFLAWFDRHAPDGKLDEIEAARQLESFRRETGKLREISFDTISGTGPNGAVVHYRVNVETNRQIQPGEIYLVDSGAQYSDGTTDITRTIAVGEATPEMRRHATLVLKGHIAIASARFPVGTRGLDIDPLARRALWQNGLDFDHGTGHGVGSYLSVHEGPQSISRRSEVILKPGMIISNEPGFYLEGAYGIRIENLVLVKPPTKFGGGDRDMLSMETLTFAPFDRRLIDAALLTADELDWLNDYHASVLERVAPELDGDDLAWLETATKPLSAC